MSITITQSLSQLGIPNHVGLNELITLTASGGTGPYSWSVTGGPTRCAVNPTSGNGASFQITGQCFGMVTVTVTDISTSEKATVTLSVGSVVIAAPDGNYYVAPGATQMQGAQEAFTALNTFLFGDATTQTNEKVIKDASSVDRSAKEIKIGKGKDESTAVTCYLLNLKSLTQK